VNIINSAHQTVRYACVCCLQDWTQLQSEYRLCAIDTATWTCTVGSDRCHNGPWDDCGKCNIYVFTATDW